MPASAMLPACDVLVTGGTGFVGRSLVRRLVAEGYSVRIISRQVRPAMDSVASVYNADLTAPDDLRRALRGCAALFHCAAEKSDPDKMQAVNVTATSMLMETAADCQIKLFCHLSSVGVIGRTHATVVDETTPCHPMNRYEETKLAAEEILAQGIPAGRVVILRPTNIFGAETVRGLCENSVRARGRLWLTGREKAHFVYVEDVVAAAIHWLRVPEGGPVETFIVSSDSEPGNTHREIQARVAARICVAPRAPVFPAPRSMAYYARLLRGRRANRGDIIYSSRKLESSGFRFPYGLRAGLDAALEQVGAAPGPG